MITLLHGLSTITDYKWASLYWFENCNDFGDWAMTKDHSSWPRSTKRTEISQKAKEIAKSGGKVVPGKYCCSSQYAFERFCVNQARESERDTDVIDKIQRNLVDVHWGYTRPCRADEVLF